METKQKNKKAKIILYDEIDIIEILKKKEEQNSEKITKQEQKKISTAIQ